MAKSTALDTLIELATSETDEAAKRLGTALRTANETEQKLSLLLQYRDDYTARFHAMMANGLSAAGYRNFQLFLDKLDAAIEGQQQIVAAAQRRIGEERDAWQASERKRMSYGTLATRAQTAEERKEMRRDQKQTDEIATRQTHYKQR
ncbi:MAG TPA: flagellar export protein FliJ [Paucimonas sp.]|nr:flagellar export protein FliJ [Paucimonas sp.]